MQVHDTTITGLETALKKVKQQVQRYDNGKIECIIMSKDVYATMKPCSPDKIFGIPLALLEKGQKILLICHT
jgi:hypothetical protein